MQVACEVAVISRGGGAQREQVGARLQSLIWSQGNPAPRLWKVRSGRLTVADYLSGLSVADIHAHARESAI